MMYESMIYWVLQFNSIVVCFIMQSSLNYRIAFPENFSLSNSSANKKVKIKKIQKLDVMMGSNWDRLLISAVLNSFSHLS